MTSVLDSCFAALLSDNHAVDTGRSDEAIIIQVVGFGLCLAVMVVSAVCCFDHIYCCPRSILLVSHRQLDMTRAQVSHAGIQR